MVVIISLKSMEQEHQDEVWIQEIYSFIGTVGGSLGLFIGFSYTGFVGKILDYFIQDYWIQFLHHSSNNLQSECFVIGI